MNYRLDHIAISCKDLNKAVQFYEQFFGGEATAIRKGSTGYRFCFVKIDGSTPIQLMESSENTGIHHYGFITDDVERVALEFRDKGAQILRENRDATGKLTTIFLNDANGLQVEVRLPR